MNKRRIAAAGVVLAACVGMGFTGGARGVREAIGADGAAVVTKSHMQLPLGLPAPEILAMTMEGKRVTLASMKGKPVVLEFGSITEPMFRMRVPAVEKLAEKYGEKVQFVIVYQHEAHAADGNDPIQQNEMDGYAIAAPTTMEERYKLAQQAQERLKIKKETMVVDAWSNTTSLRYGGYPNMTFIIDAKGDLVAGYPWMDPNKVRMAVDALLAGKEIPPALRGPVHASGKGGDVTASAMEMMGYGGEAKLAMVLDDMQLTEEQKGAIFPPLTQFMADLRNFRETRNGGGQAAKKGKGAETQPGDGVKVVTAEDLQSDIQALRESAQRVKNAVKQALPADEAEKVLDALDRGPMRRFFADR